MPLVHCQGSATALHKEERPARIGTKRFPKWVCGGPEKFMQIAVYGSGYLGTVVSACLADFGTPVSCCHANSARMVEMAQGNIPFFEKNLKEVIRRNVRAGRPVYSTDVESFARRMRVIFLSEDY